MFSELRRKLRKLEEFSLDDVLISGVVASRRDHILRQRLQLTDKHLTTEGMRNVRSRSRVIYSITRN